MVNVFLSRIIEKGCVVNDNIWYTNALLNGLFKVDLLTGKVSYMGTVEKKERYLKRAYSEILHYKGSLYMIPYNAAAIGIYNISTSQFDTISIPEKMNEKFYEAVLIKDKIYLLPHKAKKFYCLETYTKKLSIIDEAQNGGVSVFSAVEKDGEIWFAEDGGYRLLCYQPQNNKFRSIDLGKANGRFSSVGKVGNKIIVTAIDRALALCIDPETEHVTYFDFEKYSKIKGERNYYIAEYQDKAMLIRIGSNDCVMINIQNGEITQNTFLPMPLKIYGKIWKSELGITMLPTVQDKTFRFFAGNSILLNDEEALKDWAKSIDFQWKYYDPMPDYGMKHLFQIVNSISINKSAKQGDSNNSLYKLLI